MWTGDTRQLWRNGSKKQSRSSLIFCTVGNQCILKFSLQLKHNNKHHLATPPSLISPNWIWSLNKAAGLQVLWTAASCSTKHILMRNLLILFKTALSDRKTIPLANLHAGPLLSMPPLLPHMHAPELHWEDTYAACLQCIGFAPARSPVCWSKRLREKESSKWGWFSVCT